MPQWCKAGLSGRLVRQFDQNAVGRLDEGGPNPHGPGAGFLREFHTGPFQARREHIQVIDPNPDVMQRVSRPLGIGRSMAPDADLHAVQRHTDAGRVAVWSQRRAERRAEVRLLETRGGFDILREQVNVVKLTTHDRSLPFSVHLG